MAAITLLLSLFEGHMNVQLVQTLTQSLRYKPMIALMDATYREWADEHGIRERDSIVLKVWDEAKELLRAFFLAWLQRTNSKTHSIWRAVYSCS